MLTKIEVTYLAILRVILLIAATIALIVTFGAAVTAVPVFVQMVGIGGTAPTRGATLGDFIAANRITDVDFSREDAAASTSKLPLPESVSEASKAFARYDAKNGGQQFEQSKWDDLFRSLLTEKVSVTQHEDYGEDLLRLAHQLERSKGRVLSDQRLFELIEFHLNSFQADAQAKEQAKAANVAASLSKLVLAGAAFLVFVLVLFSFLFVKIERNLRARDVQMQPEWTE